MPKFFQQITGLMIRSGNSRFVIDELGEVYEGIKSRRGAVIAALLS